MNCLEKFKANIGQRVNFKTNKMGFEVIRVKGSYHRLQHPDGRKTTVPVHKNKDLPKGLLRKIIQEDLKMKLEDVLK